jgi:hypothetical protein
MQHKFWNRFKNYDLSDIYEGIKNPHKIKRELNFYINKANNAIYHIKAKRSVDIMSEDWDNLIILDACRSDVFSEVISGFYGVSGGMDYRITKASRSKEFYEKNFDNNEFYDTILVTANPNIEHISDSFFKTVKTYGLNDRYNESSAKKYMGFWPDIVSEESIRQHNKHHNKKLMIHFMQPHAPFISETAIQEYEKIRNQYDVGVKRADLMFENRPEFENRFKTVSNHVSSWYGLRRKGYISQHLLEDLYAENIKLVLEYVRDIIDSVDGKTIITSDHGEFLGENGRFGHPQSAGGVEVRQVPWFTIENSSRRKITNEPPAGSTKVDADTVSSNLEALGYK